MHEATSGMDRRRASGAAIGVATALLVCGCAGGNTGTGTAAATEAEWRIFATPRPTPLPEAARVSITDVQLLGALPWDSSAVQLSPELAIEELVVAGLLRRRDVLLVERRRFAQAVARERSGGERPRGAPAAGVSPGAEYLATATWIGLALPRSTVELRLTNALTGSVVTSFRVAVEGEVGALPLARSIVNALMGALDRVDRRPAWEDPLADADGTTSGFDVSDAMVLSFMRGIVAENTWDWDEARRRYQVAAGDARFHEASVALARAARLRLGGTLGES